MKKLMIALAAVAMAAFAQAASIDWKFTETAQASKSPLDISGYTAYLFTSEAWNNVLASDVGKGVQLDAFTGWAGSANITTTVMGGGAGVKYDTGTAVGTGTSGNYFIVLSDLSTGYVASSELTATSYESPTEQHIAAQWIIAASGSPITAVSGTFANVPEPTSGLLLLLGMAGLALKRKVA